MERNRAITRRAFSAGLVGLTAKAERPIAGSFVNDAFPLGHRLRDRAPFKAPATRVRAPIVIVGGGIAGLSAAWRLHKRGYREFILLELEPNAGGNARWGENDITRYPWAAHYVPVPSKKAELVRELFEDLGVLKDGKWDDRALCFAPQERLFLYGRWQEGLEPEIMAKDDREQFRRFFGMIGDFRSSGEFAIPRETSAVRSRALDESTVEAWMDQNRFDSPYLRWYVNYACRDDYGASMRHTSAWAGIHYFASREPEDKGPLTWPEGNGWITRQLLSRLRQYIRTSAAVYRISRAGTRLSVLTEAVEYIADAVVFAAPTFLAPYVIEGGAGSAGYEYSPWLTANLTLERPPEEKGAEPAWDNVIYDSPALGYVNATHMSLASQRVRNVWTYYWSFALYPPAQARRMLLAKDWNDWKEAIMNDLSRAHPDIRQCVSRIDIMRHGHAMIRPTPGFLSRKPPSVPRIFFANSDVSGISIFEEAQYHGVMAAEKALATVSHA